MLLDGIELLDQSTATNFAIASGTTFPDASTGELFFKVGAGLHIYDGSAWVQAGSGGDVTSAAITTALGYTPAALQNGKILTSQIPAIAITDTFIVASQAAMLALTDAEVGDIAVRSDTNTTFILKTAGASTLANWVQLLSPSSGVTSVNGQTGAAVLSTSDVAEGSRAYFTVPRARQAISVTGAGSYDSTNGIITINAPSSSNLTLANGTGGTTQVQYNANGVLSGSPSFTYVAGTSTLSVGTVSVGTALKFSDGTTMTTAASSSSSGLPIDIAGSCIGKPIAAVAIMRFVANRAFTMPAGLTGSIATASVTATAASAFSLQKNGTQIGSVTYGAGATTGTLSMASAQTFAPGDLITLIAPSAIDATLADFQFTLAGTLT